MSCAFLGTSVPVLFEAVIQCVHLQPPQVASGVHGTSDLSYLGENLVADLCGATHVYSLVCP